MKSFKEYNSLTEDVLIEEILSINEDLLVEAVGNIMNAEDHHLYKKRSAEDMGLHPKEAVDSALQSDDTSVRIMNKNIKHKTGDLVGARLNLNVLKNTKVPVLTLHKATNKSNYKRGQGFYKGDAEAYHHVVTLRNAYFNVHQKGREQIASSKISKHPMASVDGEFVKTDKPNFDGVEVSFNPKSQHLFVDGAGNAVKSAEHVTLHGHRAYLRGKIEFHTEDTAPKKFGETPSQTKYMG